MGDHHMNLLVRQFLSMDLGLGIGALIPFIASELSGSQEQELDVHRPELGLSIILALASFLFLIWVCVCFPRSLHELPARVRFPFAVPIADNVAERACSVGWGVTATPIRDRVFLISSGTARVFVQSAAIFAVALWMKDAD